MIQKMTDAGARFSGHHKIQPCRVGATGGRDDDFDAVGQIVPFRLHDIRFAVGAKGDEEETGLIVVGLFGVDDGNLPLGAVQLVYEPVGVCLSSY